MTTKNTSSSYYSQFPSEIRTSLESGAYRALCQHLQERSDEVQNIDLMNISGFCRNCLAKWLVMEGRTLSAILKQQLENDQEETSLQGGQSIASFLDAYGYDEAAQQVYGCKYSLWKERHGKKASDEQMKRYGESTSLHAKHDDAATAQHSLTTNQESSNNSNLYTTTTTTPEIQSRLEAGAFRSLCNHLRDRSDQVQNIDLMTVSGFCRNCLAKWLVLEARKISKSIRDNDDGQEQRQQTLANNHHLLDAFGYDEAAEEVYGCLYSDWKKSHATKVTDSQMVNYKASANIHAKHDKTVLSKISNSKEQPVSTIAKKDDTIVNKPQPPPLLSNVCCQDMEPSVSTTTNNGTNTAFTQLSELDNSRMHQRAVSSAFIPPPPPDGPISLKVGILTVSDRAASGEYTTGDLSGPKLEESILALTEKINENNTRDNDKNDLNSPSPVSCHIVLKGIVPDETKKIQHHILTWSGKGSGEGENTRADVEGEEESETITPPCDLIFTTGGTGFSPRDVTPEATVAILDRECRGLMSFCSAECSALQPLAALSRGCAGVCGQTIVVNLPGNPSAIGQIVDILFPLLIHAVKDLQAN